MIIKGKNLAILVIVLFTGLIYANSLRNSFIWDDDSHISETNLIKSWDNFPLLFTKSHLTVSSELTNSDRTDMESGEASYRPVCTITFFIDYFFWQLNPFGYHLTNLLLHIANCILLYLLALSITKNPKIAIFASLLFASHPVNSEAVGVIAFREDLLAVLFMLSSFILFIKLDTVSRIKKGCLYLSSLLFFLLALFSKEAAIVFPPLLLLYDYFFKKFPRSIREYFKLRYLGYAIVLGFYCFIRFFILVNPDKPGVVYLINNFYTRVFTMLKVFSIYIRWILFPVGICPVLPDSPTLIAYSITDPLVITAILLIVIIFIFTVRLRKREVLISFGILWFFIAIFPVSNIFYNLPNHIAGRYLYFPVIGFCFLAAALLAKLSRKVYRNSMIIILYFILYLPLSGIRPGKMITYYGIK